MGNILAKASRSEPDVLVATLDFDKMEKFREMFPFLRVRQPDTYSELTKERN
jgi:predicted amidohydrolase